MIPPAVDSELPSNLGNFKDCVLFEEKLAPDELQVNSTKLTRALK